jgi:uroporphyrinogen decarboxylase
MTAVAAQRRYSFPSRLGANVVYAKAIMTSKERVLSCFNGTLPDRVPRWCGSSPEFWSKAKRETGLDDEALRRRIGDDFRRVSAVYRGPIPDTPIRCRSVSPFGIEREGIGYGIAKTDPPLAGASDVAEVEAFNWPSPDWVDVSGVRHKASASGSSSLR